MYWTKTKNGFRHFNIDHDGCDICGKTLLGPNGFTADGIFPGTRKWRDGTIPTEEGGVCEALGGIVTCDECWTDDEPDSDPSVLLDHDLVF